MLPAGTKVEGANGTYTPMGAPRISYASPPYSGGLALKLAVEHLEGKTIPKLTTLPLPLVTNETVKYCKEGTWEEMKEGCNAFPPALVPNPGWFASIYSAQTPEIGLQAALVGQHRLHDRAHLQRRDVRTHVHLAARAVAVDHPLHRLQGVGEPRVVRAEHRKQPL